MPTQPWDKILMGEHRVIERVVTLLVGEAERLRSSGDEGEKHREWIAGCIEFLDSFMDKCHNMKEEKVLFPLLEQRGIPREHGPIGVMLLEHERERGFLRSIKAKLGKVDQKAVQDESKGLGELVKDHVWKEDETLYPMGKKVLSEADAGRLVIEFEDIEKGLGKGFHEKYLDAAGKLEKEVGAEPLIRNIRIEVLDSMLDTLPVEITLIDAEDTLRYFNKEKEKKYFARPRAAIGRKVQKCHPQKSIQSVNQLLDSFRSGKRDVAESWIDLKGRKIYIRYFAVRDQKGKYLGTMEVVQDITDIKKIEGENRIVK